MSGYLWRVTRVRVDSLLAERGLAASRTAAASAVRAGEVRVGADGPVLSKPSDLVEPDADLRVEQLRPFVSRGGIKLDNALEELDLDVRGRDALDVGASTGGFTDCLLQRGAARVIALDVGHGQLDWGLRNDERVIAIERRNAREIVPDELPYAPDLIVVDVSFISLSKLLGPIVSVAADGADVVAMVKPQFELSPELVGKGGVVRSGRDRRAAIASVVEAAGRSGLRLRGAASSGLPGPKGNRETFAWFDREGTGVDLDLALDGIEP